MEPKVPGALSDESLLVQLARLPAVALPISACGRQTWRCVVWKHALTICTVARHLRDYPLHH